jgi:hypothetical protein
VLAVKESNGGFDFRPRFRCITTNWRRVDGYSNVTVATVEFEIGFSSRLPLILILSHFICDTNCFG